MPFGDYGHYRLFGTDKTTDVVLAVGDAGKDNVITPKSANHQLFIQKITASIVTAAAQAITIRDDAGTPVVIDVIPASQATSIILDYGPKGRALTVGKNLDIVNTAGPAFDFHIEAYEKLRGDVGVALGTGPNGILN